MALKSNKLKVKPPATKVGSPDASVAYINLIALSTNISPSKVLVSNNSLF